MLPRVSVVSRLALLDKRPSNQIKSAAAGENDEMQFLKRSVWFIFVLKIIDM